MPCNMLSTKHVARHVICSVERSGSKFEPRTLGIPSPALCQLRQEPGTYPHCRICSPQRQRMLQYVAELSNLKCHAGIGLTNTTAYQSVQIKGVFLIVFEDRIFHDLPHHILHLSSSEGEILIPICWYLLHVKALDATIFYWLLLLMLPFFTAYFYCLLHSLVQIWSTSLKSNTPAGL